MFRSKGSHTLTECLQASLRPFSRNNYIASTLAAWVVKGQTIYLRDICKSSKTTVEMTCWGYNKSKIVTRRRRNRCCMPSSARLYETVELLGGYGSMSLQLHLHANGAFWYILVTLTTQNSGQFCLNDYFWLINIFLVVGR